MTDGRYRIRQFDKALHDRGAFSCGVKSIDNWVKGSISEETRSDHIRLWCGTDEEGTFFGVYALNPHSVLPAEATGLARRRERKPIPVLYLTCLAIDVRFQKQGLGEALMAHAIEKAVKLSREIPVAAIVLDVLDDDKFDRRLNFYIRPGFVSFDPANPARMYLPISDARRSVEQAGAG